MSTLKSNAKKTAVVALIIYILDISLTHPMMLGYIGIYIYFKLIFTLFSKKAGVGLTSLVVLPLFLRNHFLLARYVWIAVLLVVVAWFVYLAVTRSFNDTQKNGLVRVGIFALLFVAIFTTYNINKRIARSRAEMLITTIEKYKQERGEYPRTLEDLVPDYIKKVPKSRYAGMFSNFYYRSADGHTSLMYVELPPFGRPYYSFERGSWGYLD